MPSLKVMLFGTGSNVVVTAGLARGVFSRHGLTLDIRYTQGSEMLCETLRTGGCDIGVLAADDVVYEVERRGLDFFLFMGIHTGLLSLMARPEVTRLADLAGRRSGLTIPPRASSCSPATSCAITAWPRRPTPSSRPRA